MEVANTPLVLLILDGFGIAPISKGNAIAQARTPNLDKLISVYPSTTLLASGEAVGLPWAELGNSEVGHLNIGAGKVMHQSLPLINKSIGDGTFFSNEGFVAAVNHVKKHDSNLHIMGLLSNSGIHGQLDHLLALLEFCQKHEISKVYLHPILDGRDSPQDSAADYLKRLQDKMIATGVGKIASLSGRFYAMDRDNRWDRIEKAYMAIANGESDRRAQDPLQAINQSYEGKVYDEQFIPTVLTGEDGAAVGPIKDNDSIIFYNFWADPGPGLKKAFLDGGVQVVDFEYLSTPTFYFVIPHFNLHAGVILSASHNPAEYNGFKIVTQKNGKVYKIGSKTGLKGIQENATKDIQIKKKGGVISTIKTGVEEEVKSALNTFYSDQKKKLKE